MVYQWIQRLIDYAVFVNLIKPDDCIVIRNQLIDLMQLNDWKEQDISDKIYSLDNILEELVNDACNRKIINDTSASRDLFDTKIMGVLTPFPREIIETFNAIYAQSPEHATNWYYSFSRNINYVRSGRMEKDIRWKYESEYGLLDITINRSKPEKDPRDIAAAINAKNANYPKCQLCPENAGFAGTLSHPARQNLRPVPVVINNEKWQLQYSPYGYYNEHCILFNTKHTPMVIDRSVFEKLFDAVEQFPHYFFGSNADLPIVGGSILSHEHFQGGRFTFAMEKAPVEFIFSVAGYSNVSAGLVKWPMSVIRLSSESRYELTDACEMILNLWKNYDDAESGIYSHTNGVPHNTITPIARKNEEKYVCDLVLRNNRTTVERPLGLFHPNPALHHIKKENIGLIEVMGLAVLPSRLAGEMDILKNCMCQRGDVSENLEAAEHAQWAEEVLKRHPEFSEENADKILKKEIGMVFEQVLFDSGVFKRTENGKSAFLRFVDKIMGDSK